MVYVVVRVYVPVNLHWQDKIPLPTKSYIIQTKKEGFKKVHKIKSSKAKLQIKIIYYIDQYFP